MRPPTSVVRVFLGRPDKGGEFKGSAFFVGPDIALTALHVVRDADPAQLFVQVGWNGVAAIRVTIVVPHSDEKIDVAILRIGPTLTAPVSELVRLAEVPELAHGDKLVLLGHLDMHSPLEVRPAKVSGFEAVAGAAATDPWPTPGMSGGPATSPDLVLRGINWARDRDGGRGYITPFASFRDFLEENGIDMQTPACPYPGLASFGLEDAGLFFGREDAVADLAAQVSQQSFTAVMGASGSGKSSLVLAGVQSVLQDDVTFAVCRIAHELDKDPFRALARALVQLLAPQDDATEQMVQIRKLSEALHSGKLDLVGDVLSAIPSAGQRPIRIVIDQFEELFTLVPTETCVCFLNLLCVAFGDQAIAARSGLVITMRGDFMSNALVHRGFADMLKGALFPVGPMTESEILEAIKRPAALVGVNFEHDLPERLARNAGTQAGSLPLLQFALREMWAAMKDRCLTHDVYDALGGLDEALARHAEETFRVLVSTGAFSDDDFRRLFTRLVIRIDGQPPTRRVVGEDDIATESLNLAGKLSEENNRLVVANRQFDDSVTFDIVHEALAWKWPRLVDWLESDSDFQNWQRRIEPLLDDWSGLDSENKTPVSGGLLARGVEFLENRAEDLSVNERDYIARSRDLEAERIARDDEREASLNRAESLRLVMEAERIAVHEPETALRLAWEALSRDRNDLTESHFRQAVGRIKATTQELVSPCQHARRQGFGWSKQGLIWAVKRNGQGKVWQPNGAVAATFHTSVLPSNKVVSEAVPSGILCVSQSGNVELIGWDGASRATLCLKRPKDWSPSFVNETIIASREDGIVVVCIENRCWVLDTKDGHVRLRTEIDYLSGLEAKPLLSVRPFSATISPYDDKFLVENSSGYAEVFDLDGNRMGRMTPPDSGGFQGVLFLSDGNLAAGDMAGSGQIWAENGAKIISVYSALTDGKDLFVRSLAPDGNAFTTCHNTAGGHVTLRDTAGQPLAAFSAGSAKFWDADISSDGEILAAAGDDASVNLWHWASNRHICELAGHRATVSKVRFHPENPDRLLSLDQDGSIRMWRIAESPLSDIWTYDDEPALIEKVDETVVSTGKTFFPTVLSTGENSAERLEEVLVSLSASGTLVTKTIDQLVVRCIDIPDHLPVRISLPSGLLQSDFEVVTSNDAGRIAVIPRSGQPLTALLYDERGEDVACLLGEDVNPMRDSDPKAVGAVMSPDGKYLGVGSRGGPIWVWTGDGALEAAWMAEDNNAPDILFEFVSGPNDGLLVSGVRDSFNIWNWQGEPITSLRFRGYKPLKIAIGRAMGRILTVSDNPNGNSRAHAEFWRESGEPVPLQDDFDPGYFPRIHFDPRGEYCVVQSEELRIISPEGSIIDRLFPGRNEYVVETAISTTGNLIAVLLSGGTVRLWSATARRWTAQIATNATRPIAFGPGDRQLLIGHASGRIERLPLSVDDLFEPARNRLTRSFDREEQQRFSLTENTMLSNFLDAKTQLPS